jgi:hypothetical protein
VSEQYGHPEQARPAWPTGPVDEPAPVRPSWAGLTEEQKEAKKRELNAKLVIAVLIGLVSVTGAVMTWRSAQLGENATDGDRLTLAQTVQQRKDEADNELTVQDARRTVAQVANSVRASAVLTLQAESFDGRDDDAAQDAREEAEEQTVLAQGYLSSFDAPVPLTDYVTINGADVAFDQQGFRDDLRALSQSEAQANPDLTARSANELRDRSQHYDAWRIPLGGAVVLLAVAQIVGQKSIRLGLAGLATVVWIVATVFAFGGG